MTQGVSKPEGLAIRVGKTPLQNPGINRKKEHLQSCHYEKGQKNEIMERVYLLF